MSAGEQVRVSPPGMPDLATVGTIVLGSANGGALAISFGEDYVPFINGATGMAIHPEHGKILLLSRMDDGSWSDVFGGRQFEIEPYVCPV